MSSLTTDNADPILKELYKGQKVVDVTYPVRPAFASMAKFEGFGGRNLPIPIKYGNPQGRSATFSLAQANRTESKYKAFLLTRKHDYSIASIDGDTIESTRGDNMAFLSALTDHIDNAMESLADAIETFIFRNGEGWIGKISSGSNVATKTITLASIHDVTNFEVGMSINAIDPADPDGATRNTDAEEVISAIDRSAGTLTATSAAWNTVITAIAALDLLAVAGDAADAGADKKIGGFEGWIPETAPSSGDSWNGVDRSVDTRLSGQRHDGSSQSVEEALIDGQSAGAREGGKMDSGFVNHVNCRTLKKELGSRIQYQKIPAKTAKGDHASISFRSLTVEGDHGPIDIMSANKCPADVAWLLASKTWRFNSLGPATKFLMSDGLRILRQASADGYEVRTGMRGDISCNAPGHNVRVKLTDPDA